MTRLAFLVLALATVFAAPAPAAQSTLGLDTAAFDRSVRPQDDLFRHVNGRWLATSEIPADRVRYGTFDVLRQQSQVHVRAILEEAAAGRFADDPDGARVGAYYTALMDSARAEELGAEPIRPNLDRIDALRR